MIRQIFEHERSPPQDWDKIVLTGHFDHDDVVPIATRLWEWLGSTGIDTTLLIPADSDEEITCVITIKNGEIEEAAVRNFLEKLHARSKVDFIRGDKQ